MDSAKRASMRGEGPLAALFRKTEQDGAEPTASSPPQTAAAGGPTGAEGRPGAARALDPLPAASAAEPTRTPSPQDRMRHAFSADLPDDVMGRSSSAPSTPSWGHYDEPAPASPLSSPGHPRLRVVGVGGGGVNAVNRMVEAEVSGVEFIALNTDMQSLGSSTADVTVQIGQQLTRGLGSGSDPELGRASAMEDYDKIKALLKGSDMVFIAAGSGGGTGTGSAPVVARIAREVGALTVGIVTKPFGFEGSRRMLQAEKGIQALSGEVDTLIVVPNDKLLTVLDKTTTMTQAFSVADDVLRQGVQGISDLITLPGLINLDFADVRTIMSDAGNALLGIGMGQGERRALDAAEQAVSSPLLETSMEGAKSILLSITGGSDLSLWEVNEAAKAVGEAAHPDANIIFGAMVDEKLADDQVWITVVATGFGDGRPYAGASGARASFASSEPVHTPAPAERPRPRAEDRPRVAERPRERFDREQRERGGRTEAPRGGGRGGMDVDVPEFIPRF